jgi:hypothetical protein
MDILTTFLDLSNPTPQKKPNKPRAIRPSLAQFQASHAINARAALVRNAGALEASENNVMRHVRPALRYGKGVRRAA